jgi:hypothetical protein
VEIKQLILTDRDLTKLRDKMALAVCFSEGSGWLVVVKVQFCKKQFFSRGVYRRERNGMELLSNERQ